MKEQARSLKANKSDVCVVEPNVSKSIGIVIEHNGTDFQKFAEVSTCLQARDYKGFNNYGQTGVIEMMNNIVEVGNLYELGEKGYNRMNGAVVSVIGVSPALRTGNSGGHNELKVLEEPCICASRGRNPKNPSDRTAGTDLEQRIEVNQAETSNALTTVHKDNLVIEPVMLTPKRNEYGKSIRKEYENGDIAESRHNMTDLIPKLESTSNTLTSVQKDNLLIEPTIIQNAHGFNKDGEFELSPAITRSDFENNNFVKQPRYRVRKLTPLECLRLMNFDDEDYRKIKGVGVSDSQVYKQCGNSIVVSCLYCIFYKAFINTEITEDKQISFFDQFTE